MLDELVKRKDIIDGVEDFKQGMWSLDRDLLRNGESTEEHYQRAAALCDQLKVTLTQGIAAVADKGDAYKEGVVWKLDDLYQVFVWINPGYEQSVALKLIAQLIIEFVPMPMSFRNLV